MHIFHNRPLCICCCAFVCGTLLTFRLSFLSALILTVTALLSACLFLLLYFRKRTRRLFLLSLCLFFAFTAIMSSFFFFHVKFQKYQSFVGKDCYIEGTVVKKIRPLPYEATFQVELSSINGSSCMVDAMLECKYASALQVGDCFSATVTARSFQTKNGDETASAIKEGMLLALVCSSHESCEILEQQSNSLRVQFTRWNEALSYRFNSILGKSTGTLASALLLGNREALDTDVTLAFERCGVTHLLALSGLHVSILIGAFDLLLRKLYLTKIPRTIVLIFLSAVYLMLTGCAPSTCRAVLMFLILSLGFCWNREYDSVTALFTVLALMLFLTPNAILDVGMWMSFVATGSIVIFMPLFQKSMNALYHKWILPKWIFGCLSSLLGALFVGLIANLGLMLIQALVFGRISLLSVPVTMLLSVPLTLMLVLSILLLLLPPVAPLCSLCASVMLSVTQHISSLEGILLPFDHFLSQSIILLLSLILIALAVFKVKRKRWFLLPLPVAIVGVLVAFGVTYGVNSGVRCDYIQESGGDLLLFSDRGKAVAVDFTDGSADGAATLVAQAYAAHCTELETLIISHYHNMASHFIDVVAGNIKVRSIRLPPPQSEWESGVAMRLMQEAELHGVEVRFDMEELAIPALDLQILDHELFESDRHTALLLSVCANGKTVVYTNASIPDSSLFPLTQNVMQNADVFILGSTGYMSASPSVFPVLPDKTKTVILAEQKLYRLLPLLDQQAVQVLIDPPLYLFYLR